MFTMNDPRLKTLGRLIRTLSFNSFLCLLAVVVFWNPSGISFSRWVKSSGVASSKGAWLLGQYQQRLLDFVNAPTWQDQVMQTAVMLGVLLATLLALWLGYKVILLLKAVLGLFFGLDWALKLILGALAIVAIIGGLWAFELNPLQAIVGVPLLGFLLYSLFAIPRYLKIWGVVFFLLLGGSVLWGLYSIGLFNPRSTLALQIAGIFILSLMLGIGNSSGFILLWWNGRLPVEDVDTTTLAERADQQHAAQNLDVGHPHHPHT